MYILKSKWCVLNGILLLTHCNFGVSYLHPDTLETAVSKLSHSKGTPVFDTTTKLDCFRPPHQYNNHEAERRTEIFIK
jgi:hypothetical protein